MATVIAVATAGPTVAVLLKVAIAFLAVQAAARTVVAGGRPSNRARPATIGAITTSQPKRGTIKVVAVSATSNRVPTEDC